MRAVSAVLHRFPEPLCMEEIEIPPLDPGQILVQVDAS